MRTRAAVLVLFVLASCSSASPSEPGPPPASAITPSPSSSPRVAVIVMENHEYDSIIGSADAPFENALARRSVLLTDEYAIAHPSLPNYLSLVGGSTFGVTSDCSDCHVSSTNLVDQLAANGLSWGAYMEAMPRPCYMGTVAGSSPHEYVVHHDPFLYLDDIRNDLGRCANVKPFSALSAALRRGALPTFTWISPDSCDDMHDCSVAVGDAWLARWVPSVLAALGPDGLLILTFDEGKSFAGCCGRAAGGHVPTILAGPAVATGKKIGTALDHYSLLRLIEDRLGLPRLRMAACRCTPTVPGQI